MTPQSNLAHANPATESDDSLRHGEFAIAAPEILTRDVQMQTLLKMAQVVANHRTPVLIEGQSGTGKELLARFIHTQSERRNGPFVAVNCAAIPDHLLESELFGYEKGAFTGALTMREGKFEQANGGTILLDEISEMPPALQVKLLRVLQEYEVDRLGGRSAMPVDVRVIATTNRSLKQLAAEGGFRDDLYYRINVFPLRVPNLHQRLDDLAVLVPHFVCKYNNDTIKEVESDAYRRMMDYTWNGNVRELENVIARAVLLSHDRPRIGSEHIVFDGLTEARLRQVGEENWDELIPQGVTLREIEKRLILKTLRDNDGNRTHASKVLNISIRTMRNKLREYRMNGELTGLAGVDG
jgi:two-component system response regulator FlrC